MARDLGVCRVSGGRKAFLAVVEALRTRLMIIFLFFESRDDVESLSELDVLGVLSEGGIVELLSELSIVEF